MNSTISALPLPWAIFAYSVLGLGLFFVLGFLGRYTTSLPWARTEEGRHLVAVSANIGAFFLLYTVLAIWPDFPGRGGLRIVLLVAIVANSGWRWWLLEKHLKERRKSGLHATDATRR